MLADLGGLAVRFVVFVAAALGWALVVAILVVSFPIALGANLYLYDSDPRRAWRETPEIYRRPRPREVR